jgi:hypothetical protein
MESNPASHLGFEEKKQKLTVRARAKHGEVLEAMHHLEAALASAAPGRERAWVKRVIKELCKVSTLLDDHARSAEADDGLLSMIEVAHARLAHRVDQLRRENRDLRETAHSLEHRLAQDDERNLPNFREVRHGISSMLNAARHYRAAENDLVFEAFSTDIGIGD